MGEWSVRSLRFSVRGSRRTVRKRRSRSSISWISGRWWAGGRAETRALLADVVGGAAVAVAEEPGGQQADRIPVAHIAVQALGPPVHLLAEAPVSPTLRRAEAVEQGLGQAAGGQGRERRRPGNGRSAAAGAVVGPRSPGSL